MEAVDEPTLRARPQRWDEPFGQDMTDDVMARLFARPEIAAIEIGRFPSHIPLAGILKNDARIMRYKPGDLIVREGDYGNSAFLILEGKVRVVLAPGLTPELLGRRKTRKKKFWQALSQLWQNRRIPEVREAKSAASKNQRAAESAQETRVFLQDIPAILDAHKTALLEEGALFGELAALGRIPRTATVFAETDPVALLEIRWQGLRELRKYDPAWRRMIDERYRANALTTHLGETPLFKGLEPSVLDQVAAQTVFETFGAFDWNVSYQKLRRGEAGKSTQEPLIAGQGEIPQGLMLVRAGFARVSMHAAGRERTLTYLGKGEMFGFDELYESWRSKTPVPFQTSLSALGYVDILRVPTKILEESVFPKIQPRPNRLADLAKRGPAEDAFMEWAVEERFINATQAMVIDLDKCTRCDDCVRACASTHDGNPRFVRSGKVHDRWMVAQACMHCADPVCLIGCPTGAISRSQENGVVVINDNTCVGCGVCANNCPYENILMVEIRDAAGHRILDPKNQSPVLKATQCDLCTDQLGGPACVRACPHDALKRTDFAALLKGSSA